MRVVSFWLLGLVGVALAAGCSGHYDAALRDVALSPDQRLASRLTSMEESANRAIGALEAAADAVRGSEGAGSSPSAARRVRFVNDADAAVFEYSRQVLIVTDILSAPGAEAPADTEALRASMLAAQDSLAVATESIRDRMSGTASPGSAEGLSGRSSDQDDVARRVEQAKADVAAVSRHARPVITAIERAPKEHAVSGARP